MYFDNGHNHINMLHVGTTIKGPSDVIYHPGVTPLPIELMCNVTAGVVIAWRIGGSTYTVGQLASGISSGHGLVCL